MFARLADALIFQSTTNPIPTDGKERCVVAFDGGAVEMWVQQTNPQADGDPDLHILKFPGTGGRAERASEHPAEAWPDLKAKIWAVNPPGYGSSGGRPSLKLVAKAATAAYEEVKRQAGDRPVLAVGNSLGTISALHIAAHCKVEGVICRNPPPLRDVIVGRFGFFNLNLAALAVAAQVPSELDSIKNAAIATAPCVFISSQRDRTVPPSHQERIFAAYQGEHRILKLANAGHCDLAKDGELAEYLTHLNWLRSQFESASHSPE